MLLLFLEATPSPAAAKPELAHMKPKAQSSAPIERIVMMSLGKLGAA
jgi:hypothetical protein